MQYRENKLQEVRPGNTFANYPQLQMKEGGKTSQEKHL